MNQSFNIKRLGLLFKREMIMRKSFVLISSLGAALSIFGVIIIVLLTDKNWRSWNQESYFALFLVLFAIFGILFTGTAFPAYRNQKQTMDHLLIPNSVLEKYIFEVLFRIVGFGVVFPIVFWITANLAACTIQHSELGYHFWTPINSLSSTFKSTEGVVSMLALCLFLMSIPFSGAVAFSKNPLFKTAISLAVFLGSIFLYGWLLDEILGFTHVHGFDANISEEAAFNILTGFIVISTFVLHLSSYMRLKEKEV